MGCWVTYLLVALAANSHRHQGIVFDVRYARFVLDQMVLFVLRMGKETNETRDRGYRSVAC